MNMILAWSFPFPMTTLVRVLWRSQSVHVGREVRSTIILHQCHPASDTRRKSFHEIGDGKGDAHENDRKQDLWLVEVSQMVDVRDLIEEEGEDKSGGCEAKRACPEVFREGDR